MRTPLVVVATLGVAVIVTACSSSNAGGPSACETWTTGPVTSAMVEQGCKADGDRFLATTVDCMDGTAPIFQAGDYVGRIGSPAVIDVQRRLDC